MDEIEPGMSPVPHRKVVDFLEAPLRRPLLVLVPCILIALGAAAVLRTLPEKYKASTLLVVRWAAAPTPGRSGRAAPAFPKRRLQLIAEGALSYAHLERVIQDVKPYPDLAAETTTQQLAARMRADISYDVPRADSISIAYVHGDPQTAMLVANRLARLFIEDIPRERDAQAKKAYETIDTQLESIRREIEAKSTAVRLYKERHMGSLPDQTANLAALQRIQSQDEGLREKLKSAGEQLAALEKAAADPSAMPTGTASPDSLAEISQLRRQLATLRARYTDEHPDVRALLNRIAGQEGGTAIEGSPDPKKGGEVASASLGARIELAKREMATLQAKKEGLDRRMAAFEVRMANVPRTEQDLAALNRDSEKLTEKYQALLGRKLDAEAAAKLEDGGATYEFTIMIPAVLPANPYFPNPLLFLVGGLAGGLLVGLALAVAVEAVDDSIANVRELESLVNHPVLAVIPHVGARQARGVGAK